ncbi:MAG TPA: MgtC/SapB family protein [Kofleriaceae bacterium]|nr:MgtC/SapB family protein [Kofleriaceae bacterium]
METSSLAAGLGFDLDFERFATQMVKLLLAYAFCFPMAWDREQRNRSLGLRTFPLVAVASCAFVLVGQSDHGLAGEPQAMSRVLQGIIAGVGFLGGGAIVKQGMTVRGAATAAAVWLTAALGVAVADGELGIAAGLGAIGFGTLRWLGPLKRRAVGGASGAGRDGPDRDPLDPAAGSDRGGRRA